MRIGDGTGSESGSGFSLLSFISRFHMLASCRIYHDSHYLSHIWGVPFAIMGLIKGSPPLRSYPRSYFYEIANPVNCPQAPQTMSTSLDRVWKSHLNSVDSLEMVQSSRQHQSPFYQYQHHLPLRNPSLASTHHLVRLRKRLPQGR